MIKEFWKNLIYKYAPPIKPPYKDNRFFAELNELERPKYLKEVYKAVIGKKLNLKKPKTFREKIQWIKLYDATPLKTKLTMQPMQKARKNHKFSIIFSFLNLHKNGKNHWTPLCPFIHKP